MSGYGSLHPAPHALPPPLTTFLLLLLLLLSCLQLGTYKVKVMLAEPKTKRARQELNLGLFGMGPLGHLQGLAGLDPTGEGVGCSVTFLCVCVLGGRSTGNRFRVDTGDGREAGGGACVDKALDYTRFLWKWNRWTQQVRVWVCVWVHEMGGGGGSWTAEQQCWPGRVAAIAGCVSHGRAANPPQLPLLNPPPSLNTLCPY
jgi:hypothetical protein